MQAAELTTSDQFTNEGFLEIPQFLNSQQILEINSKIEGAFRLPTLNGQYGYVQSQNIQYLCHTLSWGRAIVEAYTHPLLIENIDRYLGEKCRLSNFRIYRTHPSIADRMEWHVDNKVEELQKGTFITSVVPEGVGIILIVYLSPVSDGGLQIVRGSHLWSSKDAKESWDSEEAKFSKDIVTFNERPAGTAILYDTRCVHRAKPYRGGPVRTSLFGQYSTAAMPAGEDLLLNTRDLVGLTEMQQRVLRFGVAPATVNWPIPHLSEALGFSQIFDLILRRLLKDLKRVVKFIVRGLDS